MTKGKYSYQIIGDGSSWTAKIIRRISVRKTGVSKSQGDFSSESEAKEWAEKELATFLKSLGRRNKRRAESREERTSKAEDESALRPAGGKESAQEGDQEEASND